MLYLQMTWIARTSCNHCELGVKSEEHVVSYLPLSHIAAQVRNLPTPPLPLDNLLFDV